MSKVAEAGGRVPPHRSIFATLVAIMLAMAVCLLIMVAAFFQYVFRPGIASGIDRVLDLHASSVAARALQLDEARIIAEQAGITIAYDGPRGHWTTASSDAAPLKAEDNLAWHHARREIRAADGGTYVFVWELGGPVRAVHDRLLVLLLVLIAVVVLVAHVILRRALAPVRLLYAGASRIAAGDLEVEVPRLRRNELGALTDAFNQMARQVKEMVEQREQLLLDVSHELRSPLTRMKVALALAPEGEMRARMEADVADMEGLVTGILELERLREGGGLLLQRTGLVAIVAAVVDQNADRGPGVRLLPGSEAVPLDLDVERIRILLRNLLENAVKYSLPDSRPVEVSITDRAETVELRVTDDGAGIDQRDLENLFEPFFRADPARTRSRGGYGLGLSMCQRIVEAHGGSIQAAKNPDRGMTFLVTLPSGPLRTVTDKLQTPRCR